MLEKVKRGLWPRSSHSQYIPPPSEGGGNRQTDRSGPQRESGWHTGPVGALNDFLVVEEIPGVKRQLPSLQRYSETRTGNPVGGTPIVRIGRGQRSVTVAGVAVVAAEESGGIGTQGPPVLRRCAATIVRHTFDLLARTDPCERDVLRELGVGVTARSHQGQLGEGPVCKTQFGAVAACGTHVLSEAESARGKIERLLQLVPLDVIDSPFDSKLAGGVGFDTELVVPQLVMLISRRRLRDAQRLQIGSTEGRRYRIVRASEAEALAHRHVSRNVLGELVGRRHLRRHRMILARGVLVGRIGKIKSVACQAVVLARVEDPSARR